MKFLLFSLMIIISSCAGGGTDMPNITSDTEDISNVVDTTALEQNENADRDGSKNNISYSDSISLEINPPKEDDMLDGASDTLIIRDTTNLGNGKDVVDDHYSLDSIYIIYSEIISF